MNRRDFIAVGGVALALSWRVPARAQGLPIVGFLNTTSLVQAEPLLKVFRKALSDAGFVEGRNFQIEYRWANGQYELLETLTAELVRLNPAVIAATGGTVAGKAARTVTTKIPLLFVAGFDPVHEGLVTSLSNPGGNATGVAVHTAELIGKRLDMLHQLVPGRDLGMLVNPGATSMAVEIKQAQDAAEIKQAQEARKFRLHVFEARSEVGIDKAFEQAVIAGVGGILVSADSFFTGQFRQIVALAAHHRLPACYPWPQYVVAGGLISYGPDLYWAYEMLGLYASQILKGATPDKLPVQLPTTFKTTINLHVARALRIEIPPMLIADDIIE
jgi:putative ABC transport system substrate-binding protein